MRELTGIKCHKLFTPFQEIDDALVRIDDGRILDIIHDGTATNEGILDATKFIVAPGYVDIHLHGVKGYDATSGGSVAIKGMSESLVKYGVTSFFPSAVAASKETLLDFLGHTKEMWEEKPPGSRVAGAHLEGPFISPEKPGAMLTEFFRNPDSTEFLEYIEKCGNMPLRMTLAPELPNAIDIIKLANEHGVTLSLGHTNATYEVSEKAIDLGVNLINHFYTMMRGFHHRDPGLVASGLTRKKVIVELLTDLVHVHPAVIDFTYRIKGPEGIAIITDATPAAGMPDGEYIVGGQVKTYAKFGRCLQANGNLAQGALTMDQTVRNIGIRLGIEPKSIFMMSSSTPAKAVHLDQSIGSIEPGKNADFVILDQNYNVVYTIVGGILFHNAS